VKSISFVFVILSILSTNAYLDRIDEIKQVGIAEVLSINFGEL